MLLLCWYELCFDTQTLNQRVRYVVIDVFKNQDIFFVSNPWISNQDCIKHDDVGEAHFHPKLFIQLQ